MNELPQTSDLVMASGKEVASRSVWKAFALLFILLVFPLLSIIYLEFTSGWVFIAPSAYAAGGVCSLVFAALIIYSMRGRSSKWFSDSLVVMFITFPVLLLFLFPLLCIVPLRLAHTFLPKQDVIQSLQVEVIAVCSRRRNGRSWNGVSFVEGFGFLNENNCKLPSWLVEQLREGDELSWRVERSAVGFSLVKLERVSRNGAMIIDASWRGVVRN